MASSLDKLLRNCFRAFGVLDIELENPSIVNTPESHAVARFRNLLSRFTRWSRNAGGTQAVSDSLDKKLQNNTRVKLQVIRLLSHIQRLLEDAHAITVGNQVPWDQVDDDEDSQSDDERESLENSPETEIEQILAHLSDAIDNLSHLGAALREPFVDSRTTDETSPSEPFDVQHVLSKYPGVDEAIAERLGKALSDRRQLFLGQQSAERSSNRSGGRLADEPTLETLFNQLNLEDLTYQTSEQDDVFDQSSSETSYIASEDLQARQIPPLPQRATEGTPFRCLCCHQMLRGLSETAGKKHVYRDLRPYLCLESDCPIPQYRYTRRRDWMNHMLREHWTIYVCPFGCGLKSTSRNECREHLYQNHGSGKQLSEIEDLVQLSTVNKTEFPEKTACPLCEKDLQDIETYRDHVGKHQKQLALFAIPLGFTLAEDTPLRPKIANEPGEVGSAPEKGLSFKKEDFSPQDEDQKESPARTASGLDEEYSASRSTSTSFYAGGSSRKIARHGYGSTSGWQCCAAV
ncbi:hypothetical protein FPCIR_13420 [Fusarium pseudocircinatum]|uniref:C2H2-type domain-containing protein n=1 Tax=Fusarium pseudocircinatum TaxID=56676 RepID=A0A8H5NSZ8_9HYPO|nr:hypothetical protein FPCIR_13420 [Fusarium pseudocircinatum]